MPQKSTRRLFAITSGTVLPLASASCCFDGLKGASEDFRECLLAIAFAFKVKAEGKSSDWIEPQRGADERYRTGSGSYRIIFHFPFSIFHLLIVGHAAMRNESSKWEMENDPVA